MVDIDQAVRHARLIDFVSLDTKLDKRNFGLCPFHNEKTPSFNIFVGKDGKERFFCMGCGVHGDVIDYIMETRKISLIEAHKIISGETEVGYKSSEQEDRPAPHDPYENVTPIFPIPKGTKQIKIDHAIKVWNPKREKFTTYTPSSIFLYRDSDGNPFGYVLRQEVAGRKITPQVMWCEWGDNVGWSHYTFPKPKPLYGTVGKSKKVNQVIVVEGEKVVDAARLLLKLPVVTWVGGTGNSANTNWTALKGKDVVIVPDADAPGRQSANNIAKLIHEADAKSIRIVDTADMEKKKKGWDLADAPENWTSKDAKRWLRDRLDGEWKPDEPKELEVKPAQANETNWMNSLMRKDTGVMKPRSHHNVFMYLKHHDDMKGLLAWDEFSKETILLKRPVWDTKPESEYMVREVNEVDVTNAGRWLDTKELQANSDTVRRTMNAVAQENTINPAKDFFNEIEKNWDGKKRLDNWLVEYLGAQPNAYTSVVGRKWLIAAVKRVFEPGCKFDNILILEGHQDIGKSLALEELATFYGRSYFTNQIKDIARKEAAMMMQGVLIVEIAEMTGMSKAEITEVKHWITTTVDEYRPPYSAHTVKSPRQCVLAGTLNPEGGYLRDATGGRRFWPVACGDTIDISKIKKDRDQLWAEAVIQYRAGEKIYLNKKETELAKLEQKDRYQLDVWSPFINEFLSYSPGFVTPQIILTDSNGINKDKAHLGKQDIDRVSRHLISLGYIYTEEQITFNGPKIKGFKPPPPKKEREQDAE